MRHTLNIWKKKIRLEVPEMEIVQFEREEEWETSVSFLTM